MEDMLSAVNRETDHVPSFGSVDYFSLFARFSPPPSMFAATAHKIRTKRGENLQPQFLLLLPRSKSSSYFKTLMLLRLSYRGENSINKLENTFTA